MPSKTIAFFGATGGCAGYCLVHCLNAGYTCIALARTPAKLRDSLKQKGVSPSAVDDNLTITEGDIRDAAAVKRTLEHNHQTVDLIVSGIGSLPTLQWSLLRPVVLKQPNLCTDAGRAILEASHQLSKQSEKRPYIINVSTTGIPVPGCPRDVPLLFAPLYHWLLIAPHEDKLVQQQELAAHMALPEADRSLGGFTNVKASLLMDGEGHGMKSVREGPEEQPAVGYTIQRADVGRWIFEKLVKGDARETYKNKSVCITY